MTSTIDPNTEAGDRQGEVVGPCRLLGRLGAGATGTVYLAELAQKRAYGAVGTQVALKILHPTLLGSREAFQRFDREGRVGLAIAHPSVVRTLEVGTEGSGARALHFLVLEYVDGRDLRSLLRELKQVPEALLRHLGAQIARGLEAIHAQGALHRDLKPTNLLLTKDHQVKLSDLGAVRIEEDGGAGLTRGFLGTPAYAAPEQFEGRGVGPAADLYALGVVLYEAATGTHPFSSPALQGMIRRQLEEVPAKIGQSNAQLTPFLEEIVRTLLDKDPAARFPSASLLASVLEQGETSSWWRERERAVRAASPRGELRRARATPVTRLIGRAADLAALRRHQQDAAAGQGRLVLIEGEAGIGKSRLVRELVEALESEGEDVCVLHGSSPPGASWGQGAFARAVLDHFGEAALEQALERLLASTPRLVRPFEAHLLGEPLTEGATAPPSDVLHGLYCHLAKSLAAERPLLWIVEDVHFSGADGRALLFSLARAAERRPFLLVATTRTALVGEDLASLERAGLLHRLPLARLTDAEVHDLVREAGSSEALAAKVGPTLARKSDGNPFFVLEMVRELRDRTPGRAGSSSPSASRSPSPSPGPSPSPAAAGAANVDGSDAATTELDPALATAMLDVPSSVRELLLVRLRDLDRDERALVDVAAVQGFAFDPDLSARVLERKRLAILQSLASIERRLGLVRATGAGFEFDHHLLAELLYGALPPVLRAEYHALLAAAYEDRLVAAMSATGDAPGAGAGAGGSAPRPHDEATVRWSGDACAFLAEHYLKGGRPERARPYIVPALAHLAARYRNEAVVTLGAEAALAYGLADKALACDLRLAQVDCIYRLGRRREERALIEEALELAVAIGDRTREARARLALGSLLRAATDHAGARASLEAAEAAASSVGDRSTEAKAAQALGILLLPTADLAGARACFERSASIARAVADIEGEADAARNLGRVALLASDYPEAMARLEESLTLFRQTPSRHGEALTQGTIGLVLNHLGRNRDAYDRFETHARLAREAGHRGSEANALHYRGSIGPYLGRYEESRIDLERSISLIREVGDYQVEVAAVHALGGLWLAQGELARARVQFTWSYARVKELGELRWLSNVEVDLGALHLLEGDIDGAQALLESGVAHARERGLAGQEAVALRELGNVARVRGEAPRAIELYTQALTLNRRLGEQAQRAMTALALGRIATESGDPAAAETALLESAAAIPEPVAPYVGCLPQAYLALLGRRDAAGLTVSPTDWADVRAESHFLLDRLGQGGAHRALGAEIVEKLSAHLDAPARARFLSSSPVTLIARA